MGEKTCQVFTPHEIVEHMLDRIGYIHDLFGRKVLENSCGTGHFLTEIVRRYILDARERGMSDKEIKYGLERDICGIEKEKEIYEICRKNLDNVAMKLGLRDIRWDIRLQDALSLTYKPEYQFVIGNPPYITYYNMSEEDRRMIRENYSVCKTGKADYYYAFTEAALDALSPDGMMAYLIPNNFMKNRYSAELRRYILPYIVELTDFRFRKIFEKRQTSSAVIICSKQSGRDSFRYIDAENGETKEILKSNLNDKWVFDTPEKKISHKKRFGDFYRVSAPVATLLNEAFVIRDFVEGETWVEKDGFRLEKGGLRPAASPKSRQHNEGSYIIFPYFYKNGKCCRYEEAEFEGRFPQIAGYLKRYADKLAERKAERKSRWFEYGRSQALAHIDQEKLMLSTLITGHVRYYLLSRETVPYSGMYIVPKEERYTLEQAEQILSDKEFYRYVTAVGIHASGRTYRVSPRDVENYVFDEEWC